MAGLKFGGSLIGPIARQILINLKKKKEYRGGLRHSTMRNIVDPNRRYGGKGK
jgi:hypothetical protein